MDWYSTGNVKLWVKWNNTGDLFCISYDVDLIQVAWSFIFTFGYIDYCLFTKRVGIEVYHIYTFSLERYDRYRYVDVMPWHTLRYWQWGPNKDNALSQNIWFHFPIVNVTFICSNIPAEPAFGVYISQLMRYSRTWSSIHGLVDGGL